MNIAHIERSLKNGKSRIYLDYYLGGIRKRPKTEFWIYIKPKNQTEKDHNKEQLTMLGIYKSELLHKIQRNEIGYEDPKLKEKNFVQFFKKLLLKRKENGINVEGWNTTYKHLTEYCPNGILFNQLTTDFFEDFKHYLRKKKELKGVSANRYFNILKHAFYDAYRENLVRRDLLHNIKAPKSEEAIKEYLTKIEVEAISKSECKLPLLKKAFLFSCLTGMAWIDIKTLEWNHIKQDINGDWQIIFHRKKTKGLQYHPINQQAVDVLGALQNSNEMIFKNLHYNSNMNTRLREWVFMAGVKKLITFHCARHTYATLLLHKGVPITTVQRLMGHKDIKTTLMYSKVMDIDTRIASNLVTFDLNLDIK